MSTTAAPHMLFQHWPAEDLHTIGGGRRAYVQEEGAADAPDRQPAASSSSGTGRSTGEERRLRALAAVEGFPQIVVGGWVGGWVGE